MSTPELTLLYDGSCPICRWERRNLTCHDPFGRLAFIDIQAPDFDAETYGVTLDELMGRLHGITRDGRVLVGMDTLLAAYRAAGLWWVYGPLSVLPRRVSGYCYDAFARHRQTLSRWLGRHFDDPENGVACDDGVCRKR